MNMTVRLTLAARRQPAQLLIAGIALLAIILTLLGAIPAVFSFDDSYITARNAWLLAHGQMDSAYNAPALTGSTSTLHTLLIAPFTLLLSPAKAGFVVMLLCAWLYAALAWLTCQRLQLGRYAIWGFALLMLAGFTPLHLFNGLDTALAMALVLAFLNLLGATSVRSGLITALLVGLSLHVRTELLALALPVLALRLWDLRRARALGLPVPLLMVLISILAATPLLLLVHAQMGSWLPQTWRAKELFYAETCVPLSARLMELGRNASLALFMLLPVSLGLFLPTRQRAYGCIVLFTVAFLAAYGIYMPSAFSVENGAGRYIHLLLPAWAFALLLFMRAHRLSPLKPLALLTAALGLSLSLTAAQVRLVDNYNALVDAANWANTHIPEGSGVLLIDAGYFPLATGTRFHLTDLVGLKTPWVTEMYAQNRCRPDYGSLSLVIAKAADTSPWAMLPHNWQTPDLPAVIRAAGYQPVPAYETGYITIYQLEPIDR